MKNFQVATMIASGKMDEPLPAGGHADSIGVAMAEPKHHLHLPKAENSTFNDLCGLDALQTQEAIRDEVNPEKTFMMDMAL